MRHAGITAQFNLGSHPHQYVAGFFDALEGNVGIGVAGAEKYRSAPERATIIARRAGRANQAAGQGDYGSVALWMSGDEFGCQTCALGKTRQANSVRSNAAISQAVN